uniref:FERM, ARHGEF and pleckstrin domain-containing protein 1-like n=1 Tax=Sphaeramia orbicularis TaxID=375764 RepID=A0A673C7C4_9TELE
MVEPADRPSAAGQRLGAPESFGVSTLEPGLRPPVQPPGRQVSIRVQMLDDTQEVFQISQRSPGKVLFDLVCAHLNLTEGDYFGLEYQDQRKMTLWLDLLKPTLKQIRRPKNTILRFVVKFFPPDHTQLMEELTRYLFALQIKRDLACGHLICNDTSAALMVSHIIQSEIGDFDETQSWQHLLHNKYLPDQDAIRDKIMDCHRQHVGQTPAESDYQLLEIGRRLEMYGVRLHPAKDREGTKLSLSVAHTGVLVFQGYTKINAFNWSKIRKLSFKRKRFLIKLRADPSQNAHHDTLEFAMGSRDCCKIFWKICVEYHAFFRLFEEPKPKPKPILFTRGSSFRFSGRTQKQIIDYVKDSEFKKVPFERKHSKILSNSSMSPQSSSFRSQEPLTSQSNTNGFHDVLAAPGTDLTQPRQNHHGTGSAPDQHLLNPGPTCRANKGSSSSIPYIDCSDIDSECDVMKTNRATRGHSNANDSNEDEPLNKHSVGGNSHKGGQAGSLFGAVNGFYHTNHQSVIQQHQQQDMMGNRNNVDQSPNKFNLSHELTDDEVLTNGGSFHGRLPLHSTLLDEIFQGRDKRGVALGRPLGTGTRSQCSSPVISSFHPRTNSLSQAEMTNGHGQPRSASRWDDGGHYFSKRPGIVAVEIYSPITSNRTPLHFAKPFNNNNMRNRSDTDPFILSQLTSTPIHHHDSHRVGLHTQTPNSAPVERRTMITNGNHKGNLLVPGQVRSNTVQRLFGRQGKPGNNHNNLNQPVQMIDGSTSSGTDTSDTESDTGSSAYSQPLMYVNSNGVSSSPVPRSKFSFGSLQLEEGEDGEEEEGCYRFNEEDLGGRVFSC